jgi:hypothetical protein
MTYQALAEDFHTDMLAKKNVVGVGVGKKWTNNKNTGKDSLLVFVKEKVNQSIINTKDLIPKTINGYTVDVVGKSGNFSMLSYTQKTRPLKPGYSCGHLWVTAGTIGGFFKDREGQIVMLSNNHVLACTNRGIRGHVSLQPGIYDDLNWQNNIVGNLKYHRPLVGPNGSSFDAVKWSTITGYNVEDSATALVSNPDMIDLSYPTIGYPVGFRDNVNINEQVQKVGRTTQYTTGNIIATNAIVAVQYGNQNFLFKDQIITSGMAQGGDSGSALFDMDRNIIGLLFAGSNTVTIYNKIAHPRATYGLEIINVNQIKETKSFSLTVDNIVQSTLYNESTLSDAIKYAQKLSRDGKTVQITVNYKSEPAT